MPTPLTQANRSAARDSSRSARPAAKNSTRSSLPRLCPECGKPVARSDRRYCSDACHRAYKRDVNTPRISTAGIRRLAALRASGVDPAHGGEVERKRAASKRRHDKERREWERLRLEFDVEKARFVREILPGLAAVSVRQIAREVRISLRYASLVRRGVTVPHPMHNVALALLVGCREGVEA